MVKLAWPTGRRNVLAVPISPTETSWTDSVGEAAVSRSVLSMGVQPSGKSGMRYLLAAIGMMSAMAALLRTNNSPNSHGVASKVVSTVSGTYSGMLVVSTLRTRAIIMQMIPPMPKRNVPGMMNISTKNKITPITNKIAGK